MAADWWLVKGLCKEHILGVLEAGMEKDHCHISVRLRKATHAFSRPGDTEGDRAREGNVSPFWEMHSTIWGSEVYRNLMPLARQSFCYFGNVDRLASMGSSAVLASGDSSEARS